MSNALYGEVPEAVGATDHKALLRLLPPFGQAAYQLRWCKILTSYRYDRLGDYAGNFTDPDAQAVMRRFQQQLAVIEQETVRRDAARPVTCPYLRPSLCINRINA